MVEQHHVPIGGLTVGNDLPFTLIAGPCQIESAAHAMEVAQALVEATDKLGIQLIYKSSYDKANRTSASAQRGIGIDEGLPILADIRAKLGCPVLTDVHSPEQCVRAAQAVDVLQIPAFLCRQTDLLLAAAETGKAIRTECRPEIATAADILAMFGGLATELKGETLPFRYSSFVRFGSHIDERAPEATRLSPAAGASVPGNVRLRLRLDEPIHPFSVDNSTVRLIGSDGVQRLSDFAMSDLSTVIITPRTILPPGDYTLAITGVSDSAGNPAAAALSFAATGEIDMVAPRPLRSSLLGSRSEERRVGKECRSRWSPYH